MNQDLLLALLSGNHSVPPTELMAGLGVPGPQAELLARVLGERRERLERELDGAAADAPEPVPEAHTALLEWSAAAREELGDLRARVEDQGARLDTLSAALGACPACWGQDPQCRLCRGRGAPGFLPPDETAFRLYVIPAVRALRRERPARAPRTVPTPEGAAHDDVRG
jgi:hypothetical protein